MAKRARLLPAVAILACGFASTSFALPEVDYARSYVSTVEPFLSRHAVDGRLESPDASLAWRKVETEGAMATLVFVPGPGESYRMYGELLHDLAKAGLRVYAMDPRGQGLSLPGLIAPGGQQGPRAGAPWQPLNERLVHSPSFEPYVDDLVRFLKDVVKASPTQPVSLLGGSSGAVIVGLVAARHPDLVRRVVLASPLLEIGLTTSASNSAASFAYLSGQILLGRALAPAPAWQLSSGSWRAADTPLTRSHVRAAHVTEVLRKEPLLANGGVTNLWARGLADASYRLEAEAYKLRVPVLVLRGEKDAIAIGRRQRDLCLRLVDCSLVTLAGARHKLFFEVDTVRAAALEHLLRFLDIRAVSKADAISALEERRL